MIARPLNARHRAAIAALYDSPTLQLQYAALKTVVGAYARNTVLSLVDRGFATLETYDDREYVRLTRAGMELVTEARRSRFVGR